MPRELDFVDVVLLCVSIAAAGGGAVGTLMLAAKDRCASFSSAVRYAVVGSTIGSGAVGVIAALLGDPGVEGLATAPIGNAVND